jgi:tetratricopeptide (TPR) repeat protein
MWRRRLIAVLALCVVIASAALAQQDRWTELNQQAVKLCREGKSAEAINIVEKSVETAENSFGPDHPNVAVSLNFLAELYRSDGKYAEAEPLYKRSLSIIEKTLGPDHTDVAAALNNLAEFYGEQGKYSEAEPLYKRALSIYVKALGADHPVVTETLNNLTQMQKLMGKKRVDSECEECPQRIEPNKQSR